MKKILLITFLSLAVTGCSTIQKYWPRKHDPVMFDHLVTLSIVVEQINCDQPDWSQTVEISNHLSRYATWRGDPQADNLKGLLAHAERMSHGGSKTFCTLGKKTATLRIEAAKSAWEGR